MSITINGTSGISGVDGSAATPALQGSDTNTGISFGTDEVNVNTGGSTRATVDSSGRLLVGTASGTAKLEVVDSSFHQLYVRGSSTVAGIRFGNTSYTNGYIYYDEGPNLIFNINGSERMRIRSDGYIKFETANIQIGGGTNNTIFRTGADGSGIHFTTNGSIPTNETGTVSDNTETWGTSSYRWSVIYAATGTINTSDANEKQDIQDLSTAELAVAKELKGLIKTFRWKHAVAEKGDNARIHVGVIAQDVRQLFADHGLDVTKYGLWCSDTWYEVDGMAIASDGTPYTADSDGAVAKTRLGIRYEELLAFVLAAL